MNKLIIKALMVVLFFISNIASAQIYKYATVYGGVSLNSTMQPLETYEYSNGSLIETTNQFGSNYRYHIGVKKISRYKFEKKPKFYYDGIEKNASIHRSPLGGFEYLFQYEKIKDRGTEYVNRDMWLRKVGEYYVSKVQSSQNGYVDLKYNSLDLRVKKDFKNLRLTLGVVLRNHPVYGINAFKIDFPNYNDFRDVSSQLGYSYESSWIDGNNNGYFDRWEQAITIWTNEAGDTVANSSAVFQNYYSQLVADYNQDWVSEQGNQNSLSNVMGISYYKHWDKLFILAYINYFFKNYELSNYSTTTHDYDYGLIFNYKLTRSLSVYSEVSYLNYFNRIQQSVNAGINFLIL